MCTHVSLLHTRVKNAYNNLSLSSIVVSTIDSIFYVSTYGTAHVKVYNRTRVLARDSKHPKKSCDFLSSTQAMHE